MKAKPLKINTSQDENGYMECSVEEATHIELKLPCPLDHRIIPIIISGSRDSHSEIVWSWNGDIEKPTLKPSVLTSGGRWDEKMEKYTQYRCHTWITDGKARFLSDCTHDKANQTIELDEVK